MDTCFRKPRDPSSRGQSPSAPHCLRALLRGHLHWGARRGFGVIMRIVKVGRYGLGAGGRIPVQIPGTSGIFRLLVYSRFGHSAEHGYFIGSRFLLGGSVWS